MYRETIANEADYPDEALYLEPLFLQFAHRIGFVQLFNEYVQLRNPFLCLGNLALQLSGGLLLAHLGDAAYLLDKFLLILDGITGGGSDRLQHQFGQGFGADAVGKALLGFPLNGQVVGGAIIGIIAVFSAIRFCMPPPVVVHLRPAVDAEHQAREGVGDTGGIRPAYRPLYLLGKTPGFRVNNGLVGILKDQPIFRVVLHPLVPAGFFAASA